jgi:hypothetical protein
MESRRPGNSHVRFGKRRNETDRREPTRRVAPTSPWLSEPATIAVSMAIKRPQAIDDAPVRAGAQRKMAMPRLSCLREEWAKPRGRKSRRRHCGKAIEAQPSCGQIASSMRPRGCVPDGLQGKSGVRGATQEPASPSEKSQTLRTERPSRSRAGSNRKNAVSNWSVRRYRRALYRIAAGPACSRQA